MKKMLSLSISFLLVATSCFCQSDSLYIGWANSKNTSLNKSEMIMCNSRPFIGSRSEAVRKFSSIPLKQDSLFQDVLIIAGPKGPDKKIVYTIFFKFYFWEKVMVLTEVPKILNADPGGSVTIKYGGTTEVLARIISATYPGIIRWGRVYPASPRTVLI